MGLTAVEMGAIAHYVFFLIPVGRGKFINDTSLQAAANERLLRKLMLKQAEVPIDVKPTCAPRGPWGARRRPRSSRTSSPPRPGSRARRPCRRRTRRGPLLSPI